MAQAVSLLNLIPPSGKQILLARDYANERNAGGYLDANTYYMICGALQCYVAIGK